MISGWTPIKTKSMDLFKMFNIYILEYAKKNTKALKDTSDLQRTKNWKTCIVNRFGYSSNENKDMF